MKRAPAIALVLAAAAVRAEPLRLRADALATTQSPAGLLVLDGSASPSSQWSAEAIVWTAGDTLPGQHVGDVLVIALRARSADGRMFGRFGRFVATLGALRPLQIDGAAGRVRLDYGFDAEAYAGVPVQPGFFTSRAWDWVVGSRLARRLGDYGSVGVAYMEQRDDGRLALEELGFDAGYQLDKTDDVGVRAAYDLANPGLAEVTASTATRGKGWRGELYGSYRAASHILPATSLFTVLGDVPSERAGALATWQAAPRLAVTGDFAARYVDESFAPAIALRGRLALDDRGAGAITGELRRDGSADDPWTGARAALRVPLWPAFTASSELELVIPDEARGRGAMWPWALVALGYERGPWHAAVAAEASATPEDRRRLDALLSIGREWSSK
ncbi:MAG: hypothetical protein ACM31C_24815 [Acidobacteriota bacterium]